MANGSTDPTLSGWWTYNGSYNNPNAVNARPERQHSAAHLRPQPGRKEAHADRHRQIDSRRARCGAGAGLQRCGFSLRAGGSNITLLKPYKDKYLQQSTRVRDTVTYSYQHGGASLMDFLNAQSDYRTVQLAYLQLIGSYLTAASQLNLAVGREVIP
jgi:cobalt-zinc-cadmium efflux system outer membrane protein